MAKANLLGPFEPVPECSTLHIARKGNLRCTAFVLQDGGLCVFAPAKGLGDSARGSLEALGSVSHLLAPNHYHNIGLKEYAATFPGASICTTDIAAPRLEKVTGLNFDGLDALAGKLPEGINLLQPDGLKNGEVWLRVEVAEGVAWVVVDAFAGPKMTAGEARAAELGFFGIFPKLGVGDKPAYRDWVARQIKADRPTLIVPCHGALVAAADLPEQIEAIMQTYF